MSFYSVGNQPINSTGFAPVAAPSTATILAELDSTQLGTKNFTSAQTRIFVVHWIVGSDADCIWQLESADSSALSAGAVIVYPHTGAALSAQFMTRVELSANQRLRARMYSTGANASASICAEPLV